MVDINSWYYIPLDTKTERLGIIELLLDTNMYDTLEIMVSNNSTFMVKILNYGKALKNILVRTQARNYFQDHNLKNKMTKKIIPDIENLK